MSDYTELVERVREALGIGVQIAPHREDNAFVTASAALDALSALLALKDAEIERLKTPAWDRVAAHEVKRLQARVRELEEALREIEALDRKGHDSEVAAEMGYIARRALQATPTGEDGEEI